MKLSDCPFCGHPHTAATHLGASTAPTPTPKAGDVSICVNCARVAVFNGRGRELRLPTATELAAIEEDPQVQRAQALLLARRRRP